MVEANLRYSKDPQLLLDVVSAMPRRVDNTLHNFRNKLLGNVPKHRDEFNPETLLSRMEGGEKILVMDSLKDLPQNWRNLDLKKEYGIEEECIDNQADTQSSGLSDNQQDSDEDQRPGDSGESDSGVEHPEDAEEEGSATGNPQAKAPKRVILFTTIMMLGSFPSEDGAVLMEPSSHLLNNGNSFSSSIMRALGYQWPSNGFQINLLLLIRFV